MKKDFLDCVYALKAKAERRMEKLKAENIFPADGYTARVHAEELCGTVVQLDILDQLIGKYIDTHAP